MAADDLVLTLDGTDWLGVLLAGLASFFIGFIWYTPLFGKTWAKLMGLEDMQAPSAGGMAWRMGLNITGAWITSYVLWHMAVVWMPSIWAEHLGVGAVEEQAAIVYGLYAGLFAWLGFSVPFGFTRVAWENSGWKLFAINQGHDLVRFLAMGAIVVLF